MNARISILLPVRNEARFLPPALSSIFRQTFRDWELVAVDDGSTDETAEILHAAAREDTRVRLVAAPERGLVPALNAGLAFCTAPLVARMDGDDISHPRRLELQHAFMEQHPEVALVACNFRHFPRQNLRIGMLAYEKWQNSLSDHEEALRDLFVESPFVHPSVMFRKEAVLQVGGYRDMGWAEDYDLWQRLAAAGARFERLPQTLFFWRDRHERATRTMIEYSAEAFRACKLHHLQKGFLSGVDEVVLAGAGMEGRRWRAALAAAGIGVRCWVDVDPRKIGRVLHGSPVIPPDQIRADSGKMLVTIGTRGARDGIRAWAVAAGLREGYDFVCVT
ncbi:glycosyltransferase [Geobacter sp. DSM 9736]|uniref:glycosyltransferase n=1 Tax=Geobacter sp. DSM 9736 TaxID=1277350 RepID=UPI000B513D63|nr:glycosyltransferase [Geobacter sp. DSM 9736]SNB47526.1 Glycosyl transferase family 2 [Geobacter sp. DSM 9736]